MTYIVQIGEYIKLIIATCLPIALFSHFEHILQWHDVALKASTNCNPICKFYTFAYCRCSSTPSSDIRMRSNVIAKSMYIHLRAHTFI